MAVLLLVAALAVDLLSSNVRKSLGRARQEIEQRRQTEEALQQSERRLTDIIFSSNDWVWEVDANGAYTCSSGKGHSCFGPSREDIIGKSPFDFMPPEEAERVGAIFREIAADKAPTKDLENWNTTKSGESICLLTNGVPILGEKGGLRGYCGVDKDITERKRAEEALRRSEADLFEAQRLAHLGSQVYDVAEDRLEWSPEMFAIVGRSPDGFAGRAGDYFLAIHPDDRERVTRTIRNAISDRRDEEYVCRVVRPDGEIRYVHERFRPFFDASGRNVRNVGTVQDIT